MKKTLIKVIIALIICCLIIFIIYNNKETQAPKNEEIINNIENSNNENISEEGSKPKEIALTYTRGDKSNLKTIINKETSDKYDFNVYTYGGDVTITIEGDMVYDLKTALEQNVITVDDILTQAKKDVDNNIAEEGLYLDGGSTEYRYADYTILKYNTDGTNNRDLVIGMSGEIINKVNRMLFD